MATQPSGDRGGPPRRALDEVVTGLRAIGAAVEGSSGAADFLDAATGAVARALGADTCLLQPDGAGGVEVPPAPSSFHQLDPGEPALVAPWTAGNRVLGRIAVSRAPGGERFTTEDRLLLEALGAAVGIGWEQLQRRLHQGRAQSAEAERLRQEVRDTANLELMKTQILNLAAHELRGPLAVLRGYVSMIADGSIDAGTLQRILPILQGKAAQMDALVTQMLEVARQEAGQLELKLETFDFAGVAREAVEVAGLITTAGHSIYLARPPRQQMVSGDRQRIAAVMGNLIDNAIKYSPGGGTVSCTVGSEQGRVFFMVRDHGLGIDPKDMPRLFTRFGRIVTQENSHIQGTGLGLFLSQDIAHRHGGEITVTSEPGRGSEFTLWLPLQGGC